MNGAEFLFRAALFQPRRVHQRRMLWRRATATTLKLVRQGRCYHAPVRDMKFQLYEVHDFVGHYAKLAEAQGEMDESGACDRDTVDMVLESSQLLCENELAPLLADADSVGCQWLDETTVKTPPGFKEAYNIYRESGWQGLAFPPQYGGQGLPLSLAMLQGEMTATANYTWTMFPGLSKGAINTILAHGTDELKDKYLPPLVSGEFTGTSTSPPHRTRDFGIALSLLTAVASCCLC